MGSDSEIGIHMQYYQFLSLLVFVGRVAAKKIYLVKTRDFKNIRKENVRWNDKLGNRDYEIKEKISPRSSSDSDVETKNNDEYAEYDESKESSNHGGYLSKLRKRLGLQDFDGKYRSAKHRKEVK